MACAMSNRSASAAAAMQAGHDQANSKKHSSTTNANGPRRFKPTTAPDTVTAATSDWRGMMSIDTRQYTVAHGYVPARRQAALSRGGRVILKPRRL